MERHGSTGLVLSKAAAGQEGQEEQSPQARLCGEMPQYHVFHPIRTRGRSQSPPGS